MIENNPTNVSSAFLCSRACPGTIIVKTFDVVRAMRDTAWTIICGFESPAEQE